MNTIVQKNAFVKLDEYPSEKLSMIVLQSSIVNIWNTAMNAWPMLSKLAIPY